MRVVESVVPNAQIDVELPAAIFVARSDLAERASDRNRARFRDLITEEVGRDRLFAQRAQRAGKLSFYRAKDGRGRCIPRPDELGRTDQCQHAKPKQATTKLHLIEFLGNQNMLRARTTAVKQAGWWHE